MDTERIYNEQVSATRNLRQRIDKLLSLCNTEREEEYVRIYNYPATGDNRNSITIGLEVASASYSVALANKNITPMTRLVQQYGISAVKAYVCFAKNCERLGAEELSGTEKHVLEKLRAGYLDRKKGHQQLKLTLYGEIRTMESAPKDVPILAWCVHDANKFVKKTGRLTIYATHCEELAHACDGWHVIEWGGGSWIENEASQRDVKMPDWWFVSGTEFEVVANPIKWTPLPDLNNRA